MLFPLAAALMAMQTTAPPVAAPPAPAPVAPPTLARRPRPINAGNWIMESDYPIGALAGNQAGTVAFRVQVSDTGLVTSCAVTTSSGWPLLDEWTCRLISERARFTAALDTRGRPTAGAYSNRIIWRLPPPPPPVVPGAPTPAPTPPR